MNFEDMTKEQLIQELLETKGNLQNANKQLQAIQTNQSSEPIQEQQKLFYQYLLDSVSDAVISTDMQFRIKTWNKAAEIIYGYSEEEALGKVMGGEIVRTEYPEKPREEVLKDFLKNGVWRGKAYQYKKDGTPLFIDAYISQLSDKDGNVIGVVGVNRDITQKEQLEAQLRQSQKMESLGVMASGIAHEFNNVLATIQGYTEMSIEQTLEGTPLHEFLHQIHDAGKRATDLVKQILIFSRKESSKFQLFDPIPVLKQILKITRTTTPANIEMVSDLREDCGPIWGNATQIHQVAVNIINNAVQSLEDYERGTITVKAFEINCDQCPIYNDYTPSVSSVGRCFCLEVQDTGHGITQKNLSKIFDPFFTTKAKGKGTGLGLSVVHGIIENHKGKILVDSKPNQGTTFTIYLPLEKRRRPEERKHSPKPSISKGKGRLLIVEDQDAIAVLYKRFLEGNGYEVTLCKDGKEGLNTFQSNPKLYDLVFTDMEMPQMTGKQLAIELLKIRPDLPIILISGYSHKISEKSSQELGIRKFLIKPIELATLSQALKECLETNE